LAGYASERKFLYVSCSPDVTQFCVFVGKIRGSHSVPVVGVSQVFQQEFLISSERHESTSRRSGGAIHETYFYENRNE